MEYPIQTVTSYFTSVVSVTSENIGILDSLKLSNISVSACGLDEIEAKNQIANCRDKNSDDVLGDEDIKCNEIAYDSIDQSDASQVQCHLDNQNILNCQKEIPKLAAQIDLDDDQPSIRVGKTILPKTVNNTRVDDASIKENTENLNNRISCKEPNRNSQVKKVEVDQYKIDLADDPELHWVLASH